MLIKMSDINISKRFKRHSPNREKVEKAFNYIYEHGTIDEPIVIDCTNTLTDGYASYIAAELIGLNIVPCKKEFKYVVEGKFPGCKKSYYWINDDNIPLAIGDKIIVEDMKEGDYPCVVSIFTDTDVGELKSVLGKKDVRDYD